jgi:methylenetetrahydrofolate reductase (NADPH)
MKIKELIRREGGTISFEFFPPKTKADEDRLCEAIKGLKGLNPGFVSVTYGAGGGNLKNTMHVVKRIHDETPLTVMPHLTCVNQSKPELMSILNEYRQIGVENILALRGDPPRGMPEPQQVTKGCYAKDLVALAASLNAFSIGVGVYPEGHIESPSLEMDMIYTKEKIDAGADFAITQMFFDNRFFYDFMERAEKIGIDIPVIPGIMPVTDLERVKSFCQICGATLPASLVSKMQNASPEDMRKIGIDFTTRQCEDLSNHGVRHFHFYTMNRSEAVTEILRNLALDKRLTALPA